ncbi:hematopoietic progenitor cell antigen CD34 isoform X1 [Synchiropus splendidus]|uniref:hematopoietic progenitor cell antigen CD34 isoform X1 n=1 Tax=Synchiropus splendidus TaxID=270530 RepID=UPI00237E4110|nr:hematopoietic progenitor cell antigen CD34 isoform X1 [Synchiropus splendidus]
MAAASTKLRLCETLLLGFLLIGSCLNGVKAKEEDVVTATPTPMLETNPDTIPTPESEEAQDQILVFPAVNSTELTGLPDATTVAVVEIADGNGEQALEDTPDQFVVEVQTVGPESLKPETPAPEPARGDGPNNKPRPEPKVHVVCVSKEAVENKNAVNLKLKAPSNCEDTKMKLESVLPKLCGEDCKLDIYQDDNSDQILVAGQYVEEDVAGMADKFNDVNIKDETNVEEASPRWGKNSKLVLVSLLLAGLLLAALLVAGYYLKTHRKNSKGVRLAESFQVDEENQANTLVSVAPLPQEPVDKPTVNGESPPENGSSPAPTTNGHSAAATPVADTEM